jgi:hypothetical protein
LRLLFACSHIEATGFRCKKLFANGNYFGCDGDAAKQSL